MKRALFAATLFAQGFTTLAPALAASRGDVLGNSASMSVHCNEMGKALIIGEASGLVDHANSTRRVVSAVGVGAIAFEGPVGSISRRKSSNNQLFPSRCQARRQAPFGDVSQKEKS